MPWPGYLSLAPRHDQDWQPGDARQVVPSWNAGKGRSLALASASIALLRQSAENLAGRIACIEPTTLTAPEIADDGAAREWLWLRGGFPDP